MSKKSKQRKQRKTQRPLLSGLANSVALAQGAGPAQQAVRERIQRGGANYLQSNLIRIMMDCHTLRREPEFQNLHFNLERTADVRSRVMSKHESKLRELAKKSKDERQTYYDEVRIEMIEELATPAFRQDVLRRLNDLAMRLAAGKDADKYELALVLPPLLQSKEIPWGLCGLITAIYEASADRAAQEFRQGLEEFETLFKSAESKGELERLLTLPDESPDVMKLIGQVKARPGLMKHLEEEAHRALEDFEQRIMHGEIKLELFTDEELKGSLVKMAQYITENKIDPEQANQTTLAKPFGEIIYRHIGEVMTKERVKRMKEDVKRIAAQWLHEKNADGAMLHAELSYLDSDKPAENPFLYAVYVSQLKRLRHGEASADSTTDDSVTSESPSGVDERSTNSNSQPGWSERIRGFFRKRLG